MGCVVRSMLTNFMITQSKIDSATRSMSTTIGRCEHTRNSFQLQSLVLVGSVQNLCFRIPSALNPSASMPCAPISSLSYSPRLCVCWSKRFWVNSVASPPRCRSTTWNALSFENCSTAAGRKKLFTLFINFL